MSLDLSIIIPAYNRAEILKYTLESIHRAIQPLQVEIIVVDDGSQIPLEAQLQNFLNLPLRFVRQANQGSIVARNRGLSEAKGKYIFFLDSDDLVHPDKFVSQIACLEETGADVCYTDQAIAHLKGDYDSCVFEPTPALASATSAAEFYLMVQPSPSNPIYRHSYLKAALETSIVPENRVFDPVGDVWLYYNLAIHPAQIVKIDGFYTIVGQHEQERYTDHWEKLGIASLALMLSFAKNCPQHNSTLEARKTVGRCAFVSWRKLPRNFHPVFEKRMLGIWEMAPKPDLAQLGGKSFQYLARILGTKNAATLLRRIQRPDYSKIQTLSSQELNLLVDTLATV